MKRSFKPQGIAMNNIRGGPSRSPKSSPLDKTEKDTGPSGWPNWLKRLVLFQVVAQVFLASGCAPILIPAFLAMSTELDQSTSAISYLVGTYALLLGFGVLLWNPLADRFGRRPVTIVSMTIAVCAACGVASAHTYDGMMAGRVFQAFGVCGALSIGAAYINDMYSPSEKGRAVGIWALGITVGPFVSPLVGGFITYYTSYRWILWLCAILLGVLLLLQIACLPEAGTPPSELVSFPALVDSAIMKQKGHAPQNQGTSIFLSFVRIYRAMLLVPVFLVSMAFVVPFCYGIVSTTSLFPVIYGECYGLDDRAQGLLYLPLLLGSLIAEAIAGRAGDWIVYRGYKSSSLDAESTEAPLERRLIIAYGGNILSIVGLLWFGIAAERHDHWAVLAVGSGVTACGVQIMTSVCYSYIVDCYPSSAKEVATVVNLFRALGSFIVLFYNQQLVSSLGDGWGFGVQCFMIAFFSFGGLGILSFYGRRIRSWQNEEWAHHGRF
ncbi:MFS general substrate transporter [Paxillus ammoniavirescens]|nr:MFS general substrate transporter [Paxillus ammoniavirescens]